MAGRMHRNTDANLTLTRPYTYFSSLLYFVAVTLDRWFCFSTVRESNFANTWCDVSKYSASSFSKVKIMPICPILIETRSSAVAERPCDASCYWIFCLVTQDHSKWHCWVGRVLVPISISLKLSVCRTVSEMLNVKKRRDLETVGRAVVQGHWKWSRSIGHMNFYLSTLYRYWVIWRWIISWPWNLG